MDEADLKAHVHYLCREKYYHGMQAVALEGIRRFPSDPVFRFYNGLSLVLGKRVPEGIRELEPLQADPEVFLAAILTLILAHRRCSSVDREALAALDARLKEERRSASYGALGHAAAASLLSGKPERALEYLERLLKQSPRSAYGLALKGWVELTAGKESKATEALQYFESAIEYSPGKRNLDACFGKVRYHELQNNFEGAIGILNQLVVRYPSFMPPLIEKMKNLLALLEVEQALETATRILSSDSRCLEALKLKALVLVCRDGNYEEGALGIRRLHTEMEHVEPKNVELFIETAQLFSRVCGRNLTVLAETHRLAERAAQLEPGSVALVAELGRQNLLQGKVRDAARLYRNATKVDSSSVDALLGLTVCQLHDEATRETAMQQLEFLREVQGAAVSPELLLMCAQQVEADSERALGILNEAVETHFRRVRTLPYGAHYLRALDPDLLLQLADEYMRHAPVEHPLPGQVAPHAVRQAVMLLEAASRACPGLLPALLGLARTQLACADLQAAAKTLQHVLDDVDATCAEAYLLLAHIQVQQGQYQRAGQSLDAGLSYNFQVREHPLYHLVRALVLKEQGSVTECVAALQAALAVAPAGKQLALRDRATVYIELVQALSAAGDAQEAARAMQDAVVQLQGTLEEGRLAVTRATLALQTGDTKRALELLETVTPGQPYYQQARCAMADIHLHHRKDRRAFAECFRQLVHNAPDAQSLVMLGDAYMSIEEPDRAIEAYEQALKRNPRDAALASKMGRALVRTHQYGKAINYYKEAIKGEEGAELRLDLAELHMRLGQYEKADKTLTLELSAKTDTDDMDTLTWRVRLLRLLARVRERAGNLAASLGTLREARDCQLRVMKRLAGDPEQRHVTAEICQAMAEQATTMRDHDSAIKFYKEALGYSPDDPATLAALARLHMQVNDLEQCQMNCMALIKADSENEAATVMLADLAFRKVDFETAAYHFRQLLVRRPNYWTALARLVEVMRRSGGLEGAPPYLARAEAACRHAGQEAGLAYCRGLYHWYSGDATGALRHFNGARRDQEWGQQAIYNMIEICLNADDDAVAGDAYTDDEDLRGSREMALRTAERLLKELQPRPGGSGDEALNHRLLGNFLLLATRQKANVERALQDLSGLTAQEALRDHVGAALGLATGYLLLKQAPRARNQLKRVAKNVWNFEDAEYLERCWLLLADVYIQSNKYDMAGELLRRVLQHNRACTKAYEYAGYIAEKEQAYRDAAAQYERAWHYGGSSNPAIGYKLAFNYMKAKRYADAIDVCQQVLKAHPDYPRIRKEILEKCRGNLRT